MIRRLVLGLALIALALPASADLLPPGSRPVEHTLVVEPSPHFDELELYAFPTRGFGGETRILPGEPFTFSSKYGTRIYAFEKGSAPAEFEGAPVSLGDVPLKAPWRAAGDIPVQETTHEPLSSPVQSVRTRLRIASIDGAVIALEVVDEDVERSWPALALTGGSAIVGLAGLVLLARRRGRADEPS